MLSWQPAAKDRSNRFSCQHVARASIASRTAVVEFTAPGSVDDAKPTLHVLAIGTSDYEGSKLDLAYAAKDAKDMVKALQLTANPELFPKTNIQLLSTDKNQTLPSKENIRLAFEKLKSSKPNDVVVVFLSVFL